MYSQHLLYFLGASTNISNRITGKNLKINTHAALVEIKRFIEKQADIILTAYKEKITQRNLLIIRY